jgi:hypothetical protein
MSPKSPATQDSDDEPATFFEIEQRRLNNPGESRVNSDFRQLPPLPASSPWASENPTEPLIDRTEDGDQIT